MRPAFHPSCSSVERGGGGGKEEVEHVSSKTSSTRSDRACDALTTSRTSSATARPIEALERRLDGVLFLRRRHLPHQFAYGTQFLPRLTPCTLTTDQLQKLQKLQATSTSSGTREPSEMLRNVGKRLLGGVSEAQRVSTAKGHKRIYGGLILLHLTSQNSPPPAARAPSAGPASSYSIRLSLLLSCLSFYSFLFLLLPLKTTARPPRLPFPPCCHLRSARPGQSLLHPQCQVHDHRSRV